MWSDVSVYNLVWCLYFACVWFYCWYYYCELEWVDCHLETLNCLWRMKEAVVSACISYGTWIRVQEEVIEIGKVVWGEVMVDKDDARESENNLWCWFYHKVPLDYLLLSSFRGALSSLSVSLLHSALSKLSSTTHHNLLHMLDQMVVQNIHTRGCTMCKNPHLC